MQALDITSNNHARYLHTLSPFALAVVAIEYNAAEAFAPLGVSVNSKHCWYQVSPALVPLSHVMVSTIVLVGIVNRYGWYRSLF